MEKSQKYSWPGQARHKYVHTVELHTYETLENTVCLELEEEVIDSYLSGSKEFLGVMEIIHIFIVAVTQLYIFVKTLQTVHFTRIWFYCMQTISQ